MEKKTVRIYFVNNNCIELNFGNYSNAENEISDSQMLALDSWAKGPTGVCNVRTQKEIEYSIYPNNIKYISIVKNTK
jgi:hypothetical protein